MSQPTTEEIERIMFSMLSTRRGYKETAQAIHALFHPVRKPLSELANSEEDCRKVFEFFMGEPMRVNESTEKFILIYGSGTFPSIKHNGEYSHFAGKDKKPTMFEFVDFLRDLNYDVIKLIA